MLYKYLNRPKKIIDENELYVQRFDNYLLRFERYDYVLGQNMIIGVEKSIDDGRTYTPVTKDAVVVSNESTFNFLNEEIFFVISTKNISRNRDFAGMKVSVDGGETFTNAKFTYDNNRVDIITINAFPTFIDDNKLKLACSVYDIKEDGNGYQDYEINFVSSDNGLTWNLLK